MVHSNSLNNQGSFGDQLIFVELFSYSSCFKNVFFFFFFFFFFLGAIRLLAAVPANYICFT